VIPRIRLQRFGDGSGSLWLDDEFVSYALENAAKMIPAGEYIVTADNTGKHRYYRIHDVPGRTAIEMHPANWMHELGGCIALGMRLGRTRDMDPYMIASRLAFDELRHRLGDRTAFIFEINN